MPNRRFALVFVSLWVTDCPDAPSAPGRQAVSTAPDALPASIAEPFFSDASPQARLLVHRPDSVVVAYLPETRKIVAWSPQGVPLWWFTVPNQEHLVGYPSVAPNSFLFARGQKKLYAFTPNGEIQWKQPVPPASPDQFELSPVALSNSGVVLAASKTVVLAFSAEGREMWRFELPTGEQLWSRPEVANNGMISLSTHQALIQLRPDGVMQWRRSLAPPPRKAE